MCGIAGVVHTRLFGQAPNADRIALTRMADALAHRGPDGQGVWSDGPVGLAHRRLAIIDLIGGRQPMVGPTGCVLTFNGEIYNFRTLRIQLTQLGATFTEQSDTEVVLRAYEMWGEQSVTHLHGMFAFAVWDPRTRTLFAARDRIGIKPFYYQWQRGTLIFASELKAIAARGDVDLEIDDESFESFLRLQYIEGPRTIFKSVRHLPAGHTLTLTSEGHVQERRYWSARPVPHSTRSGEDDISQSDTTECLRRLTDAVTSHMVADVPVGAFLSGGLDSSLIVALMARTGPVNTFSIGFEGGPEYDERPAAALAAKRLGTHHHDRLVTADDAVSRIPRLVARMDEPLADYAALPTFLVAEVAAREVKVVLTGEGADELFGGYRRYWKERWLAPFGSMRSAYQATHLFDAGEMAGLLGRPARSREVTNAVDGLDAVNRALVRDVEGWLADDLLVKVDRMTMLCSIEARVPYLDHTFVEWALAVPGHQKIGFLPGMRKLLLRDTARSLLPREIVERPKHGLTPPLTRWFNGALGTFARDVLLDPSARIASRIDMRIVRQLVTANEVSPARGHRIWALLVYELWSRQYGVA